MTALVVLGKDATANAAFASGLSSWSAAERITNHPKEAVARRKNSTVAKSCQSGMLFQSSRSSSDGEEPE